jgi:hypothetical protein
MRSSLTLTVDGKESTLDELFGELFDEFGKAVVPDNRLISYACSQDAIAFRLVQ